MKPDYIGPWGLTDDQMQDFYERWKQLMLAATTRQYHMVTNPVHAGIYKDFVEQLIEDPWWIAQAPSDPMPLMFVDTCPPDEIVFWRKDTGAISLPEMIGRTGLGRYSKAVTPSLNGVMPMTEMKVPEGLGDLTPDAPGEGPKPKEED